MSIKSPEGGVEHPANPKENPETLVLRGRPRRAIRFRRSVIIGIAASLAIALSVVTWISLAPRSFKFAAGEESIGMGPLRQPEALAGAPSSYGDVPKLGPPLPGDLGRPILEQQRAGQEIAEQPISNAADEAEARRQRMEQAEQSARQSALLVSLASTVNTTGASASGIGAEKDEARGPADNRSNAVRAGGQFVRTSADGYTISAGSVIPASLLTGLNSDLPGLVTAQVTEAVRDSATGRVILIPQGARLIGHYDAGVKYGQKRVFLAWDRLLLPDGSSITLNKMPASDASGFSGLRDAVDNHGWQLLKGVMLSSLLGLGETLGPPGEGEIARAIRQSAKGSGGKAAEQIVGRQLDVQPTIIVRPGWPVRALVHEDLVLPAWEG